MKESIRSPQEQSAISSNVANESELDESHDGGEVGILPEQEGVADLSRYMDEIAPTQRVSGVEWQLSQQELADIKAGTKKGHLGYWRDRLAQDMGLIPENVQPMARKVIRGEPLTPSEELKLRGYIDKRTHAIRIKQQILPIQHKKRRVMSWLRARLKDIDQRHEYTTEAGRRRITYETESDSLVLGGSRRKISLGDIAADLDWGIEYDPDDSVPLELWRKIRKLSDFLKARHELEKLFNEELAVLGKKYHVASGAGIEFLEKNREPGYIAEWMVRSLLTRVQYNNPNLGFRVENSNAVEDAELKYDFKILLSKYFRGVAIEPNGMSRQEYVNIKRRIGLQFTIGKDDKEESIQKGRERLVQSKYRKLVRHPVQDVVLVKAKFEAKKYFVRWLAEGRPSGGPEQYLSREQKLALFKTTTADRLNLTDQELDNLVV